MNRVGSTGNKVLYLVVVLDKNVRAADPTINPLVGSPSARGAALRMLAFAKMSTDEAIYGGGDRFVENLYDVMR